MAKINLNQPFYSYPVDKVVDSVQTNLNELEKEENESIWEKINEQFEDNLVRILLLAGVMILFVILQFKELSKFACNHFGQCHAQFLQYQYQLQQQIKGKTWMPKQQQNKGLNRSKRFSNRRLVEIKQGDRIPANLRMVELKTITIKTDKQKSILQLKQLIQYKKNKQQYQIKLISYYQEHKYLMLGIVYNTGMKTEIGKYFKRTLRCCYKEKQEDDAPLSKRLDEQGQEINQLNMLLKDYLLLLQLFQLQELEELPNTELLYINYQKYRIYYFYLLSQNWYFNYQ
ncbi:unnamed protein product [Paramecium sonneborni]|uniref:Cation-transporting P-type ATPase N-terminal domain-containing protein n=1 Tax=Paramecium sonneborni TaxID=65129 RepID=A0A8S1Q6H0_9CILI|nr:unnamed protein product [Paramecium sonneborni]